MGLWTLLEGCLLLANALAILNEDRFLAPRGWSFQEFSGGQEKLIQGTAYWSHICNPVLESSSYDAQLPLHCCEASFWVISPGVLCRFTPYTLSLQKSFFSERAAEWYL